LIWVLARRFPGMATRSPLTWALGECRHHTSLPVPHQILFRPRPRLPHSEERSRLRGCERRRAPWKQNVERKSAIRYADAGWRRLHVGSIVRLRCTTLRFSTYAGINQLHAYIQYLTHVLQTYAGAYPPIATSVPIFLTFAASPLPDTVHSVTTRQFHHPLLHNPRGQRPKHEVHCDEIVLPLSNEVIGAILKRPESLRTGVQPRPPRFSSLPDTGHVLYVGGTEKNGAPADDGGGNEVVGEDRGYLS